MSAATAAHPRRCHSPAASSVAGDSDTDSGVAVAHPSPPGVVGRPKPCGDDTASSAAFAVGEYSVLSGGGSSLLFTTNTSPQAEKAAAKPHSPARGRELSPEGAAMDAAAMTAWRAVAGAVASDDESDCGHSAGSGSAAPTQRVVPVTLAVPQIPAQLTPGDLWSSSSPAQLSAASPAFSMCTVESPSMQSAGLRTEAQAFSPTAFTPGGFEGPQGGLYTASQAAAYGYHMQGMQGMVQQRPRPPPCPLASLADTVAGLEAGEAEYPPHVVVVQALDHKTTHRALYDTFFPMGASKALVFHDEDDVVAVCHAVARALDEMASRDGGDDALPASLALPPPPAYPVANVLQAGRRRCAGVAFFQAPDMARMAASKLNDFVPHGQSNPLHCIYAKGAQLCAALHAHTAEVTHAQAQGYPGGRQVPMDRLEASTASGSGSHSHSHSGSATPSPLAPQAVVDAPPSPVAPAVVPVPALPPAPVQMAAPAAVDVSASSEHNTSGSSDASRGSQSAVSRRTVALLQATYGHLTSPALASMATATAVRFGTMLVNLDGAALPTAAAVAGCAGFLVDGLAAWPPREAQDAVTLLLEALNGRRPGIHRCFDAVCRRAAALPAARAVLQEPAARHVMASLLHGAARPLHRAGCAVAAATLFDVGFIGGAVSGLALKLFNARAVPKNDVPLARALQAAIAAAHSLADAKRAAAGMGGEHSVDASGADPMVLDYATALQRPPLDDLEATFRSTAATFFQQHSHDGTSGDESGGEAQQSPAAAAAARHAAHHDPTTGVPSTLQTDVVARTVYLTKVPTALGDAQLRAVLERAGPLNKVRLYDGKGQAGQGDTESCFGFVEYVDVAAATAALHALDRTPVRLVGPTTVVAHDKTAAHVLSHGGFWEAVPAESTAYAVAAHLAVAAMAVLRCNPARAAIHDHDPRDAIYTAGMGRTRDCLFGATSSFQGTPHTLPGSAVPATYAAAKAASEKPWAVVEKPAVQSSSRRTPPPTPGGRREKAAASSGDTSFVVTSGAGDTSVASDATFTVSAS